MYMEDLSAAMILIPLLTLVLGAVFGYIIGTKSKNSPRVSKTIRQSGKRMTIMTMNMKKRS